jgi:hypothetical protein
VAAARRQRRELAAQGRHGRRPRQILHEHLDSVGHDLAYGWSHFLRGVRERPAGRPADGGELARQEAGLPDDQVGLDYQVGPGGPGDPSDPGDAGPYPGDSDWGETAVPMVTDGDDDLPAEEEEPRPVPERTVAVVG